MADDLHSHSMRTSLGRTRGLGSSKTGTSDAWMTRVTAVALLPLSLAFVWLILSLLHSDYNTVRDTLGNPVPALLVLLFVVAGVIHMRLGMQSIIIDYVQNERVKEWTLIVSTFFCVLVGAGCVYAVARLIAM